MAKIINIALNTSEETQVNEHKLKGNVKKHGLFKVNVTLQDSINNCETTASDAFCEFD